MDWGYAYGTLTRGLAAGSLMSYDDVYMLKDGKYVNATQEFGSFYDKRIFPELDSEIASYQKKVDSESTAIAAAEALQKGHVKQVAMSPDQQAAVGDLEDLAGLQVTRDKMLRALGRDPRAGEKKALEWLKNPLLEFYGGQVLEDIGGHDADLAKLRVKYADKFGL